MSLGRLLKANPLLRDVVRPQLFKGFDKCFQTLHENGHIPYPVAQAKRKQPLDVDGAISISSSNITIQSLPLSTQQGFKEIVRRSDNRYEMTYGLEKGGELREEILRRLDPGIFRVLDGVFETPAGTSFDFGEGLGGGGAPPPPPPPPQKRKKKNNNNEMNRTKNTLVALTTSSPYRAFSPSRAPPTNSGTSTAATCQKGTTCPATFSMFSSPWLSP